MAGPSAFLNDFCMFVQNMSSASKQGTFSSRLHDRFLTFGFLGHEVVNVLLIDAPGEHQNVSAEDRKAGQKTWTGGANLTCKGPVFTFCTKTTSTTCIAANST